MTDDEDWGWLLMSDEKWSMMVIVCFEMFETRVLLEALVWNFLRHSCRSKLWPAIFWHTRVARSSCPIAFSRHSCRSKLCLEIFWNTRVARRSGLKFFETQLSLETLAWKFLKHACRSKLWFEFFGNTRVAWSSKSKKLHRLWFVFGGGKLGGKSAGNRREIGRKSAGTRREILRFSKKSPLEKKSRP